MPQMRPRKTVNISVASCENDCKWPLQFKNFVIIPLSAKPFWPFLERTENYIRLIVSLAVTALLAFFFNCAAVRADQPAKAEAPGLSSVPKLQLRDLQDQAARFNSVLSLPEWESTPAQVDANVDAAIAEANRQLETIAQVDRKSATFENTVRALNDAYAKILQTAHRVGVLEQAHPDPKMRTRARTPDW